jgi:MFS transporter, MHS family, proline/betaine transporter
MTARTNTSRLMAAGAIGNLLEWYDFAVYGYFAAAIGRAFFPEQDKVAQVLAAFGVFAVGARESSQMEPRAVPSDWFPL